MANLVFDFLHHYQTGERRASDPADAYQYDEGHVMEAVVPVAVTSCEIHYWVRGQEEAEAYAPESITQNEDGSYSIIGHIPNTYFETYGELRVYIVVTDGTASITTYEGRIHICERSKPDDYVDDDPENEATRVLNEAREAAATATAAAETCEEVLESIPEDYSQLSDDVDTLKDGFEELTLGIDDVDGLLYIYIGDQKQGDGIDIGGEPVTYGRIELSTNTITISEESSGSVTVVLMEAPSATQVVYVAVSDSSKITASPATLTFTTENWNTPQAVTVTALSDADSDDETESVVFTSRKVSSQTLTVHVTDITPSVVTNGLQLEFDFRNLESEATTVVDTISGVTLQNLATQYFNKVTNGIYGSSNYKYASLLTSDSAYSAFKTAMASSATSGFTFEVFGTKMPNCGNTGNASFLGTKSADGYDSTPDAKSAPGINPAKMAYIDSNDAEQTATWTNTSEFDNGTVNGYITKEQQDFLQADIVYNADGTVDAYYNGYKNRTSFSTPENFASWDIDKALTPTNTYFLGAYPLGSNSNHYLTFIRMYNRPLTQSEVTQNINYNKSVIGISNFQ